MRRDFETTVRPSCWTPEESAEYIRRLRTRSTGKRVDPALTKTLRDAERAHATAVAEHGRACTAADKAAAEIETARQAFVDARQAHHAAIVSSATGTKAANLTASTAAVETARAKITTAEENAKVF